MSTNTKTAATISKDDYEALQFEHDFQHDHLKKALQIVRKYIIEYKRILTGGMSIDLALRTKGAFLYPDDKLPDYDFLSPFFHIDAYRIGEQIAAAGIPGVSVIRGLHVSTMRVRVNFVGIADCSYAAEAFYKRIPVMNLDDFLIVHPHYQMIDQHRALSLPYENAPLEVIMRRWKKDIQRYDILNKYFNLSDGLCYGSDSESDSEPDDLDTKESPFVATKLEPDDEPEDQEDDEYTGGTAHTHKHKHTNELTRIEQDIHVPIKTLTGHCVGGLASLFYWLDRAADDGLVDHNQANFKLTTTELFIQAPRLTVLTDDFKSLLKDTPQTGIKYFNAIGDKIPRRIVTDQLEIIDNRGLMTSAHLDKKTGIHFSNLQNVMCYLMTNATIGREKALVKYYSQAQDLLFAACKRYTEDKTDKWLKYLPTSETYGKFNYNETYLVSCEDFRVQFKHAVRLLKTPKNAYPTGLNTIKQELYAFKPEESELYQTDGLETTEFDYRL